MGFWLFKDFFSQILETFYKELLRECSIEMKRFACIAHCLQTGIALNNSLDWIFMDISVFSLPVQVFPPVNFTLTVSALAQVLLHWKPNPAQEQNNSTIRYEVKILSPVPEEVR